LGLSLRESLTPSQPDKENGDYREDPGNTDEHPGARRVPRTLRPRPHPADLHAPHAVERWASPWGHRLSVSPRSRRLFAE